MKDQVSFPYIGVRWQKSCTNTEERAYKYLRNLHVGTDQ